MEEREEAEDGLRVERRRARRESPDGEGTADEEAGQRAWGVQPEVGKPA